MPQRTSRRGTGLSEIKEELKECDEDAEAEVELGNGAGDDDVISIISNETSSDRTDSIQSFSSQKTNNFVQLNLTEDPLKRFQVNCIFKLKIKNFNLFS